MSKENKKSQTQQSCLTAVKCRFFAQYFHQEVWRFKDSEEDVLLLIGRNNLYDRIITDNDYLELKPLSNYTDEDAISVEEIWRKSDCRIEKYYKNVEKYKDEIIVGRNLIKYWLEECKLNFENRIDPRTIQNITDYLRSKGYAVPFMEYSVEDLVKMGWVRLV